MAILNYTTRIDPHKTIGEIQQLLSKNGAQRIMLENDSDGNPVGLAFIIQWNGIENTFSLPCNFNGVLNAMKKQKVPNALLTEKQALRVGWRILKDWIEAQMAIKQAEIASLPEIFLPYIVTKDGRTLYDRMNENTNFLLE
jgi:hypothetical protein